VLSGYGAFVVVILFNRCQCQCYIDTHTDINRFSIADELPEENNAVHLAPVPSTTGVISRPYSLAGRQSTSGDVVT